jgi:hypothetical protein
MCSSWPQLNLQVQSKFRQESTYSLIRSVSSHFLLLFWFCSDSLPCYVMKFKDLEVASLSITQYDYILLSANQKGLIIYSE